MAKELPARTRIRATVVFGVLGLVASSLGVPAVSAAEDGSSTSAASAPSGQGTGGDPTGNSPESPAAAVKSASSEREVAQASVASLQVDRAAVRAQLAEAKAARDHQFDRWALTHLASQAAQEQVQKSSLIAVQTQQQVVVARERVRNYAVEAFINPPALESMAVLAVASAEKVSRAHDLMAITADDQGRVVEELAAAEKAAERAAAAARQAATAAAEKESASKSELDALEASLRTQRRLSAQVDQRLDSAMAEVAALREVDSRAAAEMEDQELALAADSKAALGDNGPGSDTSGSDASGGGSSGRSPSARSNGSAPTTTRTTTPAPSGPPPSPPAGVVTWSDVTKVGTFWVHRSIASNVQGLISAASAAGFNLTGGGFRDPASQISLRQAHCGPTYYDIYQKPASQCAPPTAIPGRSMHERGLALDIKSGGSLITSRSDPAFQWLAANASRYGLYNLPSEPWHWSTNGT